MEQHPIPQQISSYEFKLVGEMTLKQFLKAAAGIVLALIINATKLIFFIKWPLILICAGGGLLLAFVPFQDRPLETWILSFIRSIYSPTIFLYKKRAARNWLDIDQSKVVEEEKTKEEEGEVVLKNKDKVREFIQSLPSVKREQEEKTKKKIEEDKINNKKNIVNNETQSEETINNTKTENWRDKQSNLNLKSEKLEATGKAIFGSIPMPDIPDTPNTIVGMATDGLGKIVDEVIIEIQDQHGNPSRVLKTNSLGQFKTLTPLTDGRYLIIAEKEGYIFDRVNVDLTGQIIKPIKIISNS